ncbi:MAG: exopolysaccharide biosynthesis polyprenyl glycosylphosphotransferase [Acidimicrobiales bacterium]
MWSDLVATLLVLSIVATECPWLAATHRGVRGEAELFLLSLISLYASLLAKRVYRRTRRHIVPSASDDLGVITASVVTGMFLALGLGALIGLAFHQILPLPEVVVTFAILLVALPSARVIALGSRGRRGGQPARVVVLGTGIMAEDIAARLLRSRHVEMVGFVDDEPVDGHLAMGDLSMLPSICATWSINRVIVAFPRAHPAQATEVLRSLADSVSIDVVPRYFELTGWGAEVDDVNGLTVISLGHNPTAARLALKRLVDVIAAALGLSLLVPFLIPIAIMIKVGSPGPVLFRQKRIGRRRVPFQILKLRTMRVPTLTDEDQTARGSLSIIDTEKDRQRVTGLGRFLRRTSIDEFPQLLNVLAGHMSLVGPRPLVPAECDSLGPDARQRFDLRPGITGLWQVCGQHDLRIDELCRLDSQYVTTWSLGADLRILAKTPARLLRGGSTGRCQ